MRWTLAMLTMMSLGGAACRPVPPGSIGPNCSPTDGVPERIVFLSDEARRAAAENICDSRTLDLSELPAEFVQAGCTTFGSYQLGISHASSRYAICPAPVAAGPSSCDCPRHGVPRPHPCPSAVAEFVACYSAPLIKPDNTSSGLPYGWAHTRTSVCDACLGSALPVGMVLVVWADSQTCPNDSLDHDAAIARKAHILTPVPPPPPPPGGPDPQPCTGCYGGCMAPAQ